MAKWKKLNLNYSDKILSELETLLRNYQSKHKDLSDCTCDNTNRQKVTFDDLKGKQKRAFKIVEDHLKSRSKNQLLAMILGGAGSGKSFLIHALAHLLGDKCTLTATTGIAARNVSGRTIHSVLALTRNKISTETLTTMQNALKNIQYIILDECSMMGQRLLFKFDQRLREICANDLPFGGKNIIFVGHFAQLPPVLDTPMWMKPPFDANDVKRQGYALYKQFNKIITLEKIHRQNDQTYLELLKNICEGEISHADWQLLNSRDPDLHPDILKYEKYDDIVRLFGTNPEVEKYNLDQCVKLGNPIAKVVGVHSDKTAMSADPRDFWGLENVFYASVGSKVMLRVNLLTKFGLVNGSIGIIRDIIYDQNANENDMPKVIVVEFPDYTGQPLIGHQHPNCVPLVPFTAQSFYRGKMRTRTQFPLRLCWSMTVHKSQSLTLDHAVIDIGTREIGIGMTYVALSRLKTLNGLFFKSKPFDRFQKINDSVMLRLRKQAETDLRNFENEHV